MKLIFYIAAIGIFILATVPGDSLPEPVTINDLFNHFAAFVVLSFLLDRAYKELSVRKKFAVLAAYGLFIEIVQYFIPYRECSVLDWSVDIGAVVLYFFMVKRFLVSNPLSTTFR